jgi:hypothetical protein
MMLPEEQSWQHPKFPLISLMHIGFMEDVTIFSQTCSTIRMRGGAKN